MNSNYCLYSKSRSKRPGKRSRFVNGKEVKARDADFNTRAMNGSVTVPNGSETFSSSLTLYSRGGAIKPSTSTSSLENKSNRRPTSDIGERFIKRPTARQSDCTRGELKIIDPKKPKRYVTCLQTSLSTTWKRSLSQESDEKERSSEALEVFGVQAQLHIVKKSVSTRHHTLMNNAAPNGNILRGGNDKENKPQTHTDLGEHLNIDFKPSAKEQGRKAQEKRLKQTHVFVQNDIGRQVSINTTGSSAAVASRSAMETVESMENKKPCTSYVYIRGKYSPNLYSQPTKTNTVNVQKPHLFRSITISESRLSDARSRKNSGTPMRSNSLEGAKTVIIVQRKPALRSFTLSNESMDQTDGKMGTIFESAMEDSCEGIE